MCPVAAIAVVSVTAAVAAQTDVTSCVCVRPGARCNMAVFKSSKQAGEENCFLFHCPTEQDCPLMKAQDGVNTYDIYKGKE